MIAIGRAASYALAERLRDDNHQSLCWLLDRLERRPVRADGSRVPAPFVDTKVNPLTGMDYCRADGQRGPDWTYGWIQGRALEALCVHAIALQTREPTLAARLDAASLALYARLDELYSQAHGAAFLYDSAFRPVRATASGAIELQRRDSGLSTYADAFVVKGLIAAASRHKSNALSRHLDALDDIVAAIDEERFVLDERGHIDRAALDAQPADYGPRMILLGAGAMLRRFGLSQRDTFSSRFVDHVLDHHRHRSSGLLATVRSGSECNVGHGIEFVGFALDTLDARVGAETARLLGEILDAHWKAGYVGPGVALMVRIADGRPSSPYQPWWILPETVRAATLASITATTRERRDSAIAIAAAASDAYFAHYRQSRLPIAWQTLTVDGPVDHVPATPDLDPGYHTALSFLNSIEMLERPAAIID